MLELDFSALHKISPEHGLSLAEITENSEKIPKFLEALHGKDQGFYRDAVLKDVALFKKIEEYAESAQGKYKFLVVLGIGGSALGIITLREAFGNLFEKSPPELIVLDNIDPTLISECESYIDLSQTLFLVITKSGGTPETLSQYFYFSQKIEGAELNAKDHFVFVTDPEAGFLREEATRAGITTFPIPEDVGGRFSVLTSVGLLPAALLGIDFRKLLSGAVEMRNRFLSEKFEENLSFQLATIQYLLSQKLKNVNVMMPYAQKLFRFADWYRQLLAESIGKAHNEKGENVHVGITPVNALGVTDQHSQSQLYMEGPFDKLLIFLEVQDFGKDFPIPVLNTADERINFLENTTFGELMRTEMKGTAQALTENNRPHITIGIPKISEESLGALFMLCEGATAFLGEYFGINAFDQPGVELSKAMTKKLLLSR